jgi:deferrochelatase/peroxidase EfeB
MAAKKPRTKTAAENPRRAQPHSAQPQHDQAVSVLRETYQKNFAALVEATQALTQGADAVFQRQHEFLMRAITQATTAATAPVAAGRRRAKLAPKLPRHVR